jgi:DNA-binding transcriptional regulator YiaG
MYISLWYGHLVMELQLDDYVHDAELIARGRQIVATGEMMEIRKGLGLTRRELAELLDCSQSAISKWEVNRPAPWTNYAIRIAVVMDRLRQLRKDLSSTGSASADTPRT